MAAAAILNLEKNVNSFCKYEAILTNFQQHTPGTSPCRSSGLEMQIFPIQDGGGRHLEFRKMLIVSANMKRFSPNFNSMHLVLAHVDPQG